MCFQLLFFKKPERSYLPGKKAGQEEKFTLTDGAGKLAGYLKVGASYDKTLFTKALTYADKGIALFPNRLDIRFGKCYVLKEAGDYNEFSRELVKTIEYSTTNNNEWLWSENKKMKDAAESFTDDIYDYLAGLYKEDDDNLLPFMIQIGESAIKNKRFNIEILSITSVALLLTQEYEKAIAYLKQAEQMNPKDCVVLNNIAHAYNLKGDKQNAIRYYELVLKYGNNEDKSYARDKIAELKN